MIFRNIFLVQSIVLLGFFSIDISKSQAKILTLDNTYTNYNENIYRQNNEIKKVIFIASNKETFCNTIPRPLNPNADAEKLETALDRYFRIAYNSETEGDFNTAIINYHRAAEASSCECDRSHAQAGEQAAKEAKELLKKEGISSKPTQFFWGRLQELTQSLSCVTTQ